ncbi:MAG: penicillin acylase family protein, partial [Bacteroidota bacterium]
MLRPEWFCGGVRLGLLWLSAFGIPSAFGGDEGLPGEGRDRGKTVIYRDTWGVPHIYAPTIEEGLFAVGWAQAEDRPQELLKNMLRGAGELASVEGPEALDSDRLVLMWDLCERSKALAGEMNPVVRGHLRAFVRGIKGYYTAHPQDVPSWWGTRRVDEFMVVAYARLFLQASSFEDGLRDLIRAGIRPGIRLMTRLSNQFAVSPRRSSPGAPILLGDLHLPWEGPYRMWEFRIHAGPLKGSGFTLPGIPYILLGHNERVGWSMTTGGPDVADAYELTLDTKQDSPARYRFEGGWRDLEKRARRVRVKGKADTLLFFYDSHHGPLAALGKGKGYAVRSSYAGAVDVLAPLLEFNLASDCGGIRKGLALRQLFPHNAMAADIGGNIYYQRTGRVPKRPPGYDWSRPVDGSTSRTEWLGIHPESDLLQVTNPPQGYMQNCNVPPDAMMKGSPFRPDATLPYLYADLTQPAAWGYTRRGGWTNSRGARMLELLAAETLMTAQRAMDIANDIRPFGAPRWVEALLEADERSGAAHRRDPGYAAGIGEMRSWNFELAAGSKAALIYAYWRTHIRADGGAPGMKDLSGRLDRLPGVPGGMREPLSLTDAESKLLVGSFAGSLAGLRAAFGTAEKTYGEVFRVGRGDLSWPCEGGMAEPAGLTTLRSVGYGPEDSGHTRRAQSGQTST